MVNSGVYELRLYHPTKPIERTKWCFTTYNGEYLQNELWKYSRIIQDCSWQSNEDVFTGIVSLFKAKTRKQVAMLFIHDADYQPINQLSYPRNIVTITNNHITEE